MNTEGKKTSTVIYLRVESSGAPNWKASNDAFVALKVTRYVESFRAPNLGASEASFEALGNLLRKGLMGVPWRDLKRTLTHIRQKGRRSPFSLAALDSQHGARRPLRGPKRVPIGPKGPPRRTEEGGRTAKVQTLKSDDRLNENA